jgi:glutathione S-transferase
VNQVGSVCDTEIGAGHLTCSSRAPLRGDTAHFNRVLFDARVESAAGRARKSARGAHKFRAEFDALEKTFAQHPYLLDQDLTVLDIAWFIYAHRLSLAGYPFARLHPRVDGFVQKLRAMPEFAKEVATPPKVDAHLAATRKAQLQAGKSLVMVAGF